MCNSTLKQCASVAALFLGLTTAPAFAQSTGDATMNVVIQDVLKLVVNTNSATITYATAPNYRDGVTQSIADQLSVTSNRQWGLTVQTATANLVSGANTIPVSNVSVGANAGAGTALSATPISLLSTQAAAMESKVSLAYKTSADNAAFLKPAGTYSTTMTFTVAYE